MDCQKYIIYIPHVIHLLDDFLADTPSVYQYRINHNAFLSLCDYLGVAIAPGKTLGPFRLLSFAGIELDTMRMEARLPTINLKNAEL